jgi:hypothetical protein
MKTKSNGVLTLLVGCALLFSSLITAQDKVLMTNGKVLRGKIKTEHEDYFSFDYYKKQGKVKSIELSKYRVFSVTNVDGTEAIHYKPDTAMGYTYSVNEMRMYIYGQRDAFNAYQPLPMFIFSYTVGLGSVLFDTYQFTADPNTPAGFFQRTPSMFPITIPLAFTIGSGLFAPKIRKEYASDISFMASEHYIMGFKKIAKYKRLKNAFFGSALGVISGFVVYGIGKP